VSRRASPPIKPFGALVGALGAIWVGPSRDANVFLTFVQPINNARSHGKDGKPEDFVQRAAVSVMVGRTATEGDHANGGCGFPSRAASPPHGEYSEGRLQRHRRADRAGVRWHEATDQRHAFRFGSSRRTVACGDPPVTIVAARCRRRGPRGQMPRMPAVVDDVRGASAFGIGSSRIDPSTHESRGVARCQIGGATLSIGSRREDF